MAPKRKAKVLTSVETEVENESKVAEVEESVTSNKRQRSSSVDIVKSVTIEHCKSCINPTKPRKGAFVITREGKDTPIIELLDMPRPFTKLKNLDIDEVIADILA
eukprot:gene13199-14487_t